jgi:N-acyl-D-amino-acid deacylase
MIFQNVQLLDGTGSPPRAADVSIENGRIAYIDAANAERQTRNTEPLDAEGAYLAPGFIDSHTHDDLEILHRPEHPSKIRQGVTTVVVGNCSFSNYPSGEYLGQHLGSLLGEVKSGDLFPDFESYRRTLQNNGIVLNVVSLVGHGSLRLAAMGFEQRKATAGELAKMCDLLEEQLQQGAHGLSLGLVYPPSAFAHREELVRLAKVVKQYDRLLAAHIRSYEGGLLASIEEFLDILRASEVRGCCRIFRLPANRTGAQCRLHSS